MIAVCINKWWLHIIESNPLGFAYLHSEVGPENLATFLTNVIQNDNR